MGSESLIKLLRQIDEIEAIMVDFELTNEAISAAAVGWHIEHTLLVFHGVINTLQESDPKLYKRKFNLKKEIIYILGKFPRGKAQSPKSVRPPEKLDINRTTELLEKTKIAVPKLLNMDKGVYFKHPIFGNLRLKDSIRFLELHTEHHLEIVRLARMGHSH